MLGRLKEKYAKFIGVDERKNRKKNFFLRRRYTQSATANGEKYKLNHANFNRSLRRNLIEFS